MLVDACLLARQPKKEWTDFNFNITWGNMAGFESKQEFSKQPW